MQLKQLKKDDYQALITYLKVQDYESCLNALFVLTDNNYSFESFVIRF